MIKLVISSDSTQTITRRFNQSEVIIGGDHALDADIKLLGQAFQDRHLLITKEEEDSQIRYFVINQANDPFVTLNNLPFGKQPLYGNDLIQVGDYTIRFEYEFPSTESELFPKDPTKEKLSGPIKLSQELETQPNAFDSETLQLKKKKIDPSEKNSKIDLSFPYTQSPLFQFSEKNNLAIQTHNTSSQNPKLSLKDYYLSEYDDNEEIPSKLEKKDKNQIFLPQFTKSWQSFLTIFGGFLVVITLITSIAYLWVSDQTGEDETIAAKGVADIAMALTYAQLKNIHPQNQNWSYPEFINNNLTSVLAPNHPPLADVDAHGQFADCPYMLRIHTSSDLSQFLVIAQPCPSLLQWLIPKASIIVDSFAMELRKITDLKPLNRLIVHSNNLDATNEKEISSLIKHGELIPLSILVNRAENQGFSPPKALALMHPGAENYIYNAPRYYLLGETILNNTLDLTDKYTGHNETGLFRQELNSYWKFPDFVLYSSKGLQYALNAQKALALISPNEKYLLAYIQLNGQGKIANSHLLADDSRNNLALDEKRTIEILEEAESQKQNEASANETLQPVNQALEIKETTMISKEIDKEHPLFIQLSGIANLRQATLKPYMSEIISLLKKHTELAQSDFANRFSKLQNRYEVADKEEKEKTFKKFNQLVHDNSYLPATKFIEFIHAANLDVIYKEYLANLDQKIDNHLSNEQIEIQIEAIQNSKSWQELEHHTAQINQLLQFEHIPDEIRLSTYQNHVRSIVTQKLNQFILSSTEALPSHSFNADYLQTLTNILKAVWITDSETHDFYIAEFELRDPSRT
jgi:hypothetical protein